MFACLLFACLLSAACTMYTYDGVRKQYKSSTCHAVALRVHMTEHDNAAAAS